MLSISYSDCLLVIRFRLRVFLALRVRKGRGMSAVECDPVGAVGVSLGMQDDGRVWGEAVPGMVPTWAHVEVEGFRGSCLEECVLEVTEGGDRL